MAVADVKGLPRYTKVIDASVQDTNPQLDFTEDKGTRITRNAAAGAVAAKDYSTKALEGAEKAKAATVAENERLAAENKKLQEKLAVLESAQKAAKVPAKEEVEKQGESGTKKPDSTKLPK